MRSMYQSEQLKRQAGVVSLMVTIIMMVVLTLIVVGFEEVAHYEQRTTTNDELGVEAYYAAESGVNDAAAAIANFVNTGKLILPKKTCDNGSSGYNFNTIVDQVHNVSYSCLLINPTPATLIYDVGYTSTVIPIQPAQQPITKLTLNWGESTGSNRLGGCDNNGGNPHPDNFLPASHWTCPFPVLRIDMLDVDQVSGPLKRADWKSNTATMYFIPSSGVQAPPSADLSARGTTYAAQCNSQLGECTADINLMGYQSSLYYMRITTLYSTDSLLQVTNTSGGVANLDFINAQATIDSTGLAQDELRRILVAIDLTSANAYKIPSAALITEYSVCKRFGAMPDYLRVYDDLSGGSDPNPNNLNELCIQKTYQ